MPRYVISRVADELDARSGRGLRGAKILVIGLAYKKNVDDTRESPSLRLIELLEKRGALCDVYDPLVPVIPRTRDHPTLSGRQSITLEADSISTYDAVLIVTDHNSINYKALAKHAKLIIDTRNACARVRSVGAKYRQGLTT